ncbi:Ricin B-type lectin domain-containing protein [Fusarium sp. Ph1]|nr:Ricin B-type lectin domain-containing protein [Fusarium sp. Ph1]
MEADARLFIQHEVAAIRADYNTSVSEDKRLPDDWPTDDNIQTLVNMTGQLFAYAKILCRFIGDDELGSPGQMLETVLSSQGECVASRLDELYAPILARAYIGQSTAVIDEFQQLVGAIVITDSPLSILALSRLLHVPEDTITDQLNKLHSVIDVPQSTASPIRLHHTSFRHFLLSSHSEYSLDVKLIHDYLAACCLRIMAKCLRTNICGLSSPGTDRSSVKLDHIRSCISQELQYACRYWASHVKRAGWMEDDEGRVFKFLNNHLLHWLEALSLVGSATEGISIIQAIQDSINHTRSEGLSGLLDDALQLLRHNMSVIDSNPLQLYSSVLSFAPQQSPVANSFSDHIPQWMSLRPARETLWTDCQQILEGHQDAVTSVAFSPDSSLLVSASDDHTVRLWRVSDGKCIQELLGHKDAVFSAIFFPSGDLIASGSADKTVKLWSVEDGKCLQSLKGHNSGVYEVAVSSDSALLAFGSFMPVESESGKVWIWSVTKNRYLHEIQGSWGAVYSVSFSPDSTLLASGTEDGVLRIWNIESGKCIHTLKEHDSSVLSVAFAPNSDYFASSSSDGTVRLWQLDENSSIQTFESGNFMTSISISSDSALLATASSDDEIQLWNVDDERCDLRLEGHVDRVSSVALSPCSKLLASASSDSTVRVWLPYNTSSAPKPERDHRRVCAIKFSPDHAVLASGADGSIVQLWDANNGTLIHGLRMEEEDDEEDEDEGGSGGTYVEILEFSHDGTLLVAVALDGAARLWSVVDGKCIHDLTYDEGGVSAVQFSSDSTVLFIGRGNGTIEQLTVGEGFGDEISGHRSSITAMSVSSDSTILASGAYYGTVQLWDLIDNRCLHELAGHESEVKSVVFSSNTSLLATSCEDNVICLWSVNDGSCTRWLRPSEQVRSMAFSPDSTFLATAAKDDLIQLWDTDDGESVAAHKFYRVGTSDIRFGSNGSSLIFDAGTLCIEGAISGDKGTDSAQAWVDAGFAISQDEHWVTWRGDKLLWLPVTVRPSCWTIHESTIAIGCLSGRIVIMKFDVSRV